MRVRIRRFGGLSWSGSINRGTPRESKNALGKAIAKAGGFAVRHGPSELPAVFGGEVSTDAPFAQLIERRSPSLPLLPQHRPEAAPYPLLECLQHGGGLAVAEIGTPASQ
jgi:hypothetical protein